jgi:ATP phosphoribosyltransferase
MQVSTGVTLRENNLKEIEGGHILDSQGILVGSRRALRERSGLLEVLFQGLARLLHSAANRPQGSEKALPSCRPNA